MGIAPDTNTCSAELHACYGPHRQVARSLYALPNEVVSHPYYVLLLEGAGRAEVRTITRTPDRAGRDDLGAVRTWEGAGLGDLPALLSELLMRHAAEAAREPAALRAQVEAALRGHGEFADLGVVPCPVTARGSFGHPLKTFPTGAVMRAMVLAA